MKALAKEIIYLGLIMFMLVDPSQAQSDPLFIGKSFELESAILREQRKILVAVPSDYQNTTAKYPESPEMILLYADTYLLKGDFSNAEVFYKKLVDLGFEDETIQNVLKSLK